VPYPRQRIVIEVELELDTVEQKVSYSLTICEPTPFSNVSVVIWVGVLTRLVGVEELIKLTPQLRLIRPGAVLPALSLFWSPVLHPFKDVGIGNTGVKDRHESELAPVLVKLYQPFFIGF
tara:strand:+ start:163 stop:522 length:360 start_codon:yes stop_codon:yes gene_type:complete